jgi:hypothetical protein
MTASSSEHAKTVSADKRSVAKHEIKPSRNLRLFGSWAAGALLNGWLPFDRCSFIDTMPRDVLPLMNIDSE